MSCFVMDVSEHLVSDAGTNAPEIDEAAVHRDLGCRRRVTHGRFHTSQSSENVRYLDAVTSMRPYWSDG